jgi:hypothetical protein
MGERSRWVNLDVYNAILDNSHASGSGLALLLVMAGHCDEEGICKASVPTLAKDCHVSDRAVQDARAKLLEQGELELLKFGGGNNKQDTARLRISCFRPVKKASPVQTSSPVKKDVFTGEDLRGSPVKRSSPLYMDSDKGIQNDLKNHHPLSPSSKLSEAEVTGKDDVDLRTSKAGSTQTKQAYLDEVRKIYNELPGSAPKKKRQLTSSERQLCFDWYERQISTTVIAAAFWDGMLRVIKPGQPPPEIRSVKYFQKIVDEITVMVSAMPYKGFTEDYARHRRQQALELLAPKAKAAGAPG